MSLSQQRSDALAIDMQKTLIFQAIMEVERKFAVATSPVQTELVFWRKPDSLRCGAKKIAEGALTLVPTMPLLNISTKQTSTAISFGKFTVAGHPKKIEFFGTPVPKPTAPQDRNNLAWPEQANVVAYFWVEDTANTKLVNMYESSIEKSGVSIPVLKNSVALEPHVKLYKFKPAAPKKDTSVVMDAPSATAAPSASSSSNAAAPADKPPAKATAPAAKPPATWQEPWQGTGRRCR